MAGQDPLGAIELLGEHAADQEMRPGEAAEGETEIGALQDRGRKAVGAPDEEGEVAGAAVAPGAEALGQGLAGEELARRIERHDPRPLGNGGEEELALPRDLLGGARRLARLELLERKRPDEARGIVLIERALRPAPRAADGGQEDAHRNPRFAGPPGPLALRRSAPPHSRRRGALVPTAF